MNFLINWKTNKQKGYTMKFANKNLTVLSYANGYTFWHYITEGTIEELEKNDRFFAPISTLMKKGDVIYITANDGLTYHRQIIDLSLDTVKIGKIN